MGKPVLVAQVAEPAAEVLVFVVGDAEKAVLDAEGVVAVLAGGVPGELGGPAFEVLAVEKRCPFLLVILLGSRNSGQEEGRGSQSVTGKERCWRALCSHDVLRERGPKHLKA